MSGGINYSRFDKIQVSSSDEENVQKRKPHVTTINSRDKVVIGPDGLTVLKGEEKEQHGKYKNGLENKTQRETSNIMNDNEWNNANAKREDMVNTEQTYNEQKKENENKEIKREDKEKEKKEETQKKEKKKEKEEKQVKEERQKKEEKQIQEEQEKKEEKERDEIMKKKEKQIKDMLENGSVVPYEYIWSQSTDEITAHLVLPKNTKAKDLLVEIYDDRLVVKKKKKVMENTREKKNDKGSNLVVNDTDVCSKVNCKEEPLVLINKNFPFKVSTIEETQIWEIKNMKVNWPEFWNLSKKINNQDKIHFNFENESISDNDETFLYISLKKVNEFGNCHVWWSSLFKGESQINVVKLPVRTDVKKKNIENFKNMWDQAHQIFKENISKKKIPLPLD